MTNTELMQMLDNKYSQKKLFTRYSCSENIFQINSQIPTVILRAGERKEYGDKLIYQKWLFCCDPVFKENVMGLSTKISMSCN